MVHYSYDASTVHPGGSFPLRAIFQNEGQETAYNIVITFSSSSFQTTANGGVSIIEEMESEEGEIIYQTFAVNSTVESSPGSITVQVDYKDEDGTSYSQSFTASVSIYGYDDSTATPTATPSGKPHVVIGAYSTDLTPLHPGNNFILSMSVQNRGSFPAQNVSLTINKDNSSSNFLPLDSSNVHVLDMIGNQLTKEVKTGLRGQLIHLPRRLPGNRRFRV